MTAVTTGTHAATAKEAVPDRSAELAYTSYLRVVAIFAVVLIHTAGPVYAKDGLHGTKVWWLATVMTFATKWAVPVFVMLSGALLLRPPSDPSPAAFYRRRLSRIGIPLVFWHAVYIAYLVGWGLSSPTWRKMVAKVASGEVYTGMYFFWLILGLYIVTPLLWPVVRSFSHRQLLGAAIALFAFPSVDLSTRNALSLLTNAPGHGVPTLWTQFVPYVGFFVLGYAVKDVVVRGVGRWLLALATLVVLAIPVVQVAVVSDWSKPWPDLINRVLAPISYQGWLVGLGAIALFILGRSVVSPDSRLAAPPASVRARRLGDLTLGVFAVHPLLLIVLPAVSSVPAPAAATTVPRLAGLCVLVIVLAFAASWIFSKLPLLRRTV